MSDGFASPVGFENTPEWNQGLYLQIDAAVSPEAQKYAANSPLYVSDIDDGQSLYVSNDAKSDVILPEGSIHTWATTLEHGSGVGIRSTNAGKTSANNGGLDIDDQSVMVFGGADNPSLTPREFGIGHGGNYQSIDVSLFAPFGLVGQPTVNIKTLEATLRAFTLEDPKAKARTSGEYNMKHVTGKLRPRIVHAGAQFTRPVLRVNEPQDNGKYVASGNSMAIRKLQDVATRTASGNSFVVRTLDDVKKVASGNSLVVRSFANASVRTASGNSLYVRTLANQHLAVASGNSLQVKPGISAQPKLTLEHDHDHDHDHEHEHDHHHHDHDHSSK